MRFPLFLPSIELTRKSGNENEDERERQMDENVIAVHGGTSGLELCCTFVFN